MERQTTAAKALKVNLDLVRYGAFAEIGAGQEVARHFFLAGKASQTIAKSMSAYDMIYSDEIYGKEKSGRYVCESRVIKMLEKEYSLLQRRLASHRGDKTAFFAYANTVATGTPESPRCHGWMGVQFQTKANGEPNSIILHVRMMDNRRLQQQETLGILGVNLIEAAFYRLKNPDEFIDYLIENIKTSQLVIDVIKFSGPELKHFDNASMNLQLVSHGVSEAVLFSPEMEVLNISDAVYNKSLLFQRSSYRPITKTHIDVLEKGMVQLKGESKEDVMPILEITVPPASKLDAADFIKRIEVISKLGFHTLISQFDLYYKLKHYFRRFTQKPLAVVIDASMLEKIFNESHYKDLEGGVLEGLGKLLDSQTKLYVYPHKTEKLCQTSKTFFPPKKIANIYKHFIELKQIEDISGCDEADVYLHSEDIRDLIKKKDKAWEKLVPAKVAELIKKNKDIWVS
jgi:hypothetical protein